MHARITQTTECRTPRSQNEATGCDHKFGSWSEHNDLQTEPDDGSVIPCHGPANRDRHRAGRVSDGGFSPAQAPSLTRPALIDHLTAASCRGASAPTPPRNRSRP